MKWLELSVRVPWEYVEPLSYLFNRHGRGFSIEEPEVDRVLLRTYLPSNARHALAQIDVGVRLVASLVPSTELVTTELRQEDWETAWKAHFHLLKVGKGLVVRPSWVEYEPLPHEVVIDLDPGMAFGTGYHPTTRLCLMALESLIKPGLDVLDLGTGSGILAIAAARLGAIRVVGLDIDQEAVGVARSNCRANGVSKTVSLFKGSLPHAKAPDASFHVVVANISARIIQEKATAILGAMLPHGTFIASGILASQGPEVALALEQSGFGPVSHTDMEDWTCLTAHRPD